MGWLELFRLLRVYEVITARLNDRLSNTWSDFGLTNWTARAIPAVLHTVNMLMH